MRFLADEGVEQLIVESLRKAGYEVDWVTELARGAEDSEIVRLAAQSNSILITHDKDFGDLVMRQGYEVVGVILLRMPRLSASEKAHRTLQVVKATEAQLRGYFTVITERGVRFRPLSRP